MISNDERYSRQKEIVPAERLADLQVTVIGVGAIGRQVALQLAAMGVRRLQLVDFDTVEESNLASQGYLERDLGKPKVEATGEMVRLIQAGIDLELINGRFRRGQDRGEAIFCCVDKIDTRRLIWGAVQDSVSFFTDGRMAAEVLRVITAAGTEGFAHYPTTLFSGDEAYRGSCTAKTTIYCANIAAGFMITQFTRWLRRLPIDEDVLVNLLTSEITIPA